MATSSRFDTINKEEFQKLIKAKDTESTQRSTEVGVKIFKLYLKERLYDPDFESYSKAQLADVLEQFYIEVRKEDGEEYKTGSLINIRAAINRHLKSNGHNINILNEPEFTQANLAFTAKQADLKREGYGDTQSYPPIDENDIEKLYRSGVFDTSTPGGLQSKVWFELMLFICRRGRENLRKLNKDHFGVAKDSNGRKFVYQCKDEMSKRIRGDNMKSRVDAGRMYATGGPGCPVASFEKYVSKLNPNHTALFQAPLRCAPSDEYKPWYKNALVGEKSLGNFMSKLSLAAGLSRRYTNHSLRSTCITLLDKSGFATRDICNVTGPRNEKSIRTYVGRPNDAKKQKLSDALSTSIGYAPNPPPSTSQLNGKDKPSASRGGDETAQKEKPSTASTPPTTQSSELSQPPNFDIELPLSNSQMETLEQLTVGLVQTAQPQAHPSLIQQQDNQKQQFHQT